MHQRTFITIGIALLLAGCQGQQTSAPHTEGDISRKAADLPPPITRTKSDTVVVDLVTKEVVSELAPGVTYEYWTYNGTVPGPFLRVREGDTVEVHLTHALHEDDHGDEHGALPFALTAFPFAHAHGDDMDDSHEEEMDDPHGADAEDDHAAAGHGTHSIDLHAVIGPGGGATLMQVKSGETKVFRFTASRPGLYVYHCASPHIPTHVANGMYGLILVEPKGGLPPVDREYYVVQGEFYTAGAVGEKGHQTFSKEKMLREQPEYVVFNGRKGALTGDGALRAKTGEKIRLFLGVGSHVAANFHVIGGVLDRLYPEGDLLSPPHRNVQTTVIPPGGAAMVELTLEVPGTYLLVDHSLTRAIDRGAVGELVVEGPARPDLLSAINPDPTHTHADFAVYISGRRLDFSDPKYMEEEGGEHEHDEHGHDHSTMHMHGGAGGVIHRHKPGQTFGNFFTSIGFTLTPFCLTTDSGDATCNGGGKSWRMVVNGKETAVNPGYVFADGDAILLTYGADDAAVEQQLWETGSDACLYSKTCPERGDPPTENCVADPSVPCSAPGL